jgi:NAD(P)-dependent dehydrogenase (short-subunit alcohol dehydrogenase family)
VARSPDRVAIVTGGGHRIGRAVAMALADAGAAVVVASRDAGRLAAAVRAIEARGGTAMAAPTDVTDPDQVDALVARARGAFGRVDVLAAFAGGGAIEAPLDRQAPDDLERVVRVNLLGALYSARAVLPELRARGHGTILFCSGGGAYHPVLDAGIAAYAAAKAGVCRLTDQLTAELLDTEIRVHCIDPGPVSTGAVAPEAAGELAAWLCSDASLPLRGRLVSVQDGWWRDAARVRAVHDSMRACRLWRGDP